LKETFLTKKEFFQTEIVSYWREKGRHDLPWRKTKDPWELLIAEVLLRKTTSQQVVPIYLKLAHYSPQGIINMELNELEGIIKPIGIYKIRALQLKEAAVFFNSRTSKNEITDEEFRSIKGIGRYISNMVRCVSVKAAAPGLDANMIRVLTRFFEYPSKRKRPREDLLFWKFAESLVPTQHCCEYNWGILDFGADVCTFYNPNCLECRMREHCSLFISILNFPGDAQNV
jgi:A/G-specific adenine glycosylase